jgi:phosphatidylglycerol:prolipoprotein diacylglycerol transferase
LNFESPGAIIFKLGPVTVRWYGLMFVLGFFSAAAMAMRLGKKWEMDTEELLNTAFWGFGGGVVGARLYFVLLNYKHFLEEPLQAFMIWTGGLSIHGGILGGILAGFIYCKVRKLPFLKTADLLLGSIPLAQAIGRWGNFFNSEAFGKPVSSDFPLRLFIPEANRPLEFRDQLYFHPTFLYEAVYDVLLFCILYFGLAERVKNYPGLLSCLYIAGYSIGRLIIEPMRTDSLYAFGMPAAILTSSILLGLSLVLAGVVVNYHRTHPTTSSSADHL